ncbi:MAG: hypothetical protein RI885_1046 [Actinomycetota bacterium]|jgi:colicin import membrane protein
MACETFDDSLRIALTVASQFAERIARVREQLARQREAGANQEARELLTRFEAERGAARASLAPVQLSEWWDHASPQAIADMHETATVWRDVDDVAHSASVTIRREVLQRNQIDINQPGADTAAVAAALAQAERDRANAAAERAQAGHELTATQLHFAQADQHERDAEAAAQKDPAGSGVDGGQETPTDLEQRRDIAQESGSQLYDSAERRQQFASSLEAKGIGQDTIAARMRADSENAQHPREAVSNGSGKATQGRRKASSAVQQRDRSGLSR